MALDLDALLAQVEAQLSRGRSKLPANWRSRRGLEPRQGRFFVERIGDDWQVVDWAYAATLGADIKAQATEIARMARAYVKKHGDIDFGSFPYTLDQPLEYCDPDEIDDWWAEYPP